MANSFVCWSPLSLCQTWRAHEESAVLGDVHVVAIRGTRHRARIGFMVAKARLDAHEAYHFGYSQGVHTTRCAGVSIVFRKDFAAVVRVTDMGIAEGRLGALGRCGALTVRSREVHVR